MHRALATAAAAVALAAAAAVPAGAYPNELGRCLSEQEVAGLGITPYPGRGGQKVVLDVNEWNSHYIGTNIMAYLLQETMGYSVEFHFYSGEDDSWARASDGVIDFNVEVWADAYRSAAARYFDELGTATELGALGTDGATGWFVPTHLTTGANAAKMLDYWRAYEIPANAAGFPTYPTVDASLYAEGEAPFVPPQCANATCIEFYAMNQAFDIGTIQQQIVNLGLPVVMVFLGFDNHVSVVQGHIDGGTPVLFYSWQPSEFHTVQDITRVELPMPMSGCYRDNTFSLDGVGAVDCDMRPQRLVKVARTSARGEPQLVDAWNTFVAAHLGNADMNAMLGAHAGPPGVTHEEAACQWIRNNTARWTRWVTNKGVDTLEPSAVNRAVFLSLAAVSAAIISGFMVVLTLHRRSPVVRASSYPLMIVIAGSCLLGTAAIPLLAHPGDATCVAQSWVFSTSFVVTLSTLIVKAWRVTRIFMSKRLGNTRLRYTDAYLLRIVALVALGQAVLLVLGQQLGGHDEARVRVDMDGSVRRNEADTSALAPVQRTVSCSDYTHALGAASLGYKALIMIGGVFVAFMSRQLPAGFSEAKSVAICVYNIIIGAVMSLPLVVSTTDVDVDFAARSVFVLWSTLLTALTVFGPRVYYLKYGAPAGYLDTQVNATSPAPGSAAHSRKASVTSAHSGARKASCAASGARLSRGPLRAKPASPSSASSSPRGSLVPVARPVTPRLSAGAGAGAGAGEVEMSPA